MFWPFRRRTKAVQPFDFEQFMDTMTNAAPPDRDMQQVMADFRHVFLSTARGRRVLWRIFDQCRVMRPVVPAAKDAAGRVDPLQAAFADGERNVGLRIIALCFGNVSTAANPEASESDME